MLITEFTIDHPILREPLENAPGTEAEWEHMYRQPDGPTQMLVWIETDDVVAVDTAMDADPGVMNPTLLADLGGRRLYQVDLTPLGHETNLVSKIVDIGGIIQTAVGTTDGWRVRVQVPNREAVEEVYQFCQEHDIDFALHELYQQTTWVSKDEFALTDAQRETLIEAIDSGYLSIPRECSLAELGDRLGVSESATSERFRRAVKNLVETTVHP